MSLRWPLSGPRDAARGVPCGVAWCLALLLVLASCKTSTEPDSKAGLELRLDAVPLLLKAADTLDVSTIWATVLENGSPVGDSTRVSFAATNGRIGAEAFTRDGLARVEFVPGKEVGVAAIVAQVKTVRDTVLVSLY